MWCLAYVTMLKDETILNTIDVLTGELIEEEELEEVLEELHEAKSPKAAALNYSMEDLEKQIAAAMQDRPLNDLGKLHKN